MAAYVYSPTAPATGQAVSFDASSATCADVPCTYSWADDGTDGAGGTQWPLGSGKTMSFTFQGTGVKNVRLVVTDADGDSNSTMKAITVAAAQHAPAGRHDRAEHHHRLGPERHDHRATDADVHVLVERGRLDVPCRVDSGSWAGVRQPVDHERGDRHSQRRGPRHRRRRQHRCHAGDTDVHASAAATTPQNLIGSSAVQSAADVDGSGSAEAFQATATGSGAALGCPIYVDAANTATHAGGRALPRRQRSPGTLMNKGTRSAPTAGGLEHRHASPPRRSPAARSTGSQ